MILPSKKQDGLTGGLSVGEYPYNVLTKFANLSLAYPSTQYYDCDMSKAECQGSSAITAVVTSSTA